MSRRVYPPADSCLNRVATSLVVGDILGELLHMERHHPHSVIEAIMAKWNLARAHILGMRHRNIVQLLAPPESWLVAFVALIRGSTELVRQVKGSDAEYLALGVG